MTVQKIATLTAIASLVLFASGLGMMETAFAQAQRQAPTHVQTTPRGSGMSGMSSQQERHALPVRPNYRPLPGQPNYRPLYRPPVVARHPLPRYRQPGMIVTPSILVGSVLPYGYEGYYPVDNWGYYNLPAPCCGQYWVQYDQSFLLVSPDGVVLQVFTP